MNYQRFVWALLLVVILGGISAAAFAAIGGTSPPVPATDSLAVTPTATASVATQAEAPSCCSAKLQTGPLYCPLTSTINAECCCKIVNGKWVCQVTGTVSDACCCIPVSDAK